MEDARQMLLLSFVGESWQGLADTLDTSNSQTALNRPGKTTAPHYSSRQPAADEGK